MNPRSCPLYLTVIPVRGVNRLLKRGIGRDNELIFIPVKVTGEGFLWSTGAKTWRHQIFLVVIRWSRIVHVKRKTGI